MFGYVVANPDILTPRESRRYRSFYCGLCNTLGNRHGRLSRITVNYDMTFLVLLLSSLNKTEVIPGYERCFIHPFKKHRFLKNSITDYASDMTIALAYYKFLDNWRDDKSFISLFAAKSIKEQYRRIEMLYPKQCTTMENCLRDLDDLEKSGETNPDIPANRFGVFMGEIFSMREDEYSHILRAFGHALGKFIYIMDACIDLKRDIKNKLYNPLITTPSESFRSILNLLMANCTEEYRQLPIEQDKQLIENILYSGVWTRYEGMRRKRLRSHVR